MPYACVMSIDRLQLLHLYKPGSLVSGPPRTDHIPPRPGPIAAGFTDAASNWVLLSKPRSCVERGPAAPSEVMKIPVQKYAAIDCDVAVIRLFRLCFLKDTVELSCVWPPCSCSPRGCAMQRLFPQAPAATMQRKMPLRTGIFEQHGACGTTMAS